MINALPRALSGMVVLLLLSLVILNSDKEKESAPAGLDLEIWSPFCLGLSVVVDPLPLSGTGINH